MASVRSNLPEITSAIQNIATAFTLTRRRKSSKTLGEEGLDVIRKMNIERSLGEQKGPTEAPYWADNTVQYKRRKGGKPVGVKGDTHNMLDETYFKGATLIQDKTAEEVYGADEATQLKLEWFQDPFQGIDKAGRERHQPPRKIVGEDEPTDRRLDALFDDQLDQTIRESGA